MTDRDIMKKALDALEMPIHEQPFMFMQKAIAAPSERLAHCDRCGKRHGGEVHHWIVPDFGFLFPTEDSARRHLANINSADKPSPCFVTTPPAAPMNEFEEAVAAVDNTLHYAIDHWQDRASEQAALLRECRFALDILIKKQPALAMTLCGSTTLGNLKASLYDYRVLFDDTPPAQPAPVQEPVAIHQFRTPGLADWYDGIPFPDDPDPYEVRTLYTTPHSQPAPVQETVAYEYGDDIFWHNSPDINDYIRANGKALVYTTPPAAPVQEPVPSLRSTIANDAWAISFQSLGQYRAALLKVIDSTPPAVQEPMRLYVEDFARRCGWKKDSGEGAFEYVQRKSYAQGLEDATPPAAQPAPAQEPAAWAEEINDWFLSLSEAKQAALLEEKWALAGAAFLAGKATAPAAAQAAPEDYTALEQALTRLQKRYWELHSKVAAQRTWVELTDEEIHNLDPLPHQMFDTQRIEFARAIEAKLKEKNT
jgi:hypothetical protein